MVPDRAGVATTTFFSGIPREKKNVQTPSHRDNEISLVAAARDLGAAAYGGSLSSAEIRLLRASSEIRFARGSIKALADEIGAGQDPLGDALCFLRSPLMRRGIGAFYTPSSIVEPMVWWLLDANPSRVVDAGCGSGRFSQRVLLEVPQLRVVSVDLDPIATLMTRAVLAVLRSKRSLVRNVDYTSLQLDAIESRTGYIGNPPYVRHHDLSAAAKRHAIKLAARLGHRLSGLAGLHTHFILATAAMAREGDVGAFITSSEWMDVNYGAIVRDLMLNGLGGRGVHAFAPEASPFEDAMTTAAIIYFETGSQPKGLRFERTASATFPVRLGSSGHIVPRSTLVATQRWSPILKQQSHTATIEASANISIGSIARVHRGQVTGANDYFVMSRERAEELGIKDFCRPVISRGEEILSSDGVLRDSNHLSVVLEVPPQVDLEANPRLKAYLKLGEKSINGQAPICQRWIPSHRRPWFSVKAPRPPIVATYMARQAPYFAINPDRLALINVGHGIFPKTELSDVVLRQLVQALNAMRTEFIGRGRTYHGGLEKFEPKEMENLPLANDEFLLTLLPLEISHDEGQSLLSVPGL
jgi:predicted RNA methylase